MKQYAYALFCVVCSTFFLSLHAQNNDSGGDISPESIDIVKPYEPILADAVKAEFSPDLPSLDDLAKDKPVFNDYYITPKFLTVKYEPVPLKPIGYEEDKKKKGGDKGEKCRYVWLRGGYGNLNTPLADIALSTCRTQKWLAGINASYIGSSSAIDFKDYNRIGGKAFGKFYTNSNYVGIDATYTRDTYYQYGYDHSDTTLTYTAEQLLRRYQTIGIGAELGNSAENKNVIDYNARIEYRLFSDNRDSKEHYLAIRGGVSGLINENLSWGGQIRNEFSSLNNSVTDSAYSNNLLQITPKVTYKAAFGNFSGGLTAILDGSKIYPFPYIDLEVFVMPKTLTLYGGWNKEGIKNMYQSLAGQNPFVDETLLLRNTRRENRYLGVKGAMGKGFSYNIKGFYNAIKEQPLYVNYFTDIAEQANGGKQFAVVYDPSMSELGATVEVAAHFSEIATVALSATYASRKTTVELAAWHLPPLSANVRAEIKPIDKLKITVEAYVASGMKARRDSLATPVVSHSIVDIPTIFDLNAAARFAITDNIGIFATVNNILSQRYQRFLNYDVYGLNAVGGLTLRF